MKHVVLPTFIIAGAGKAGTSYVAEVLGTHPDVFVTPTKEPAYFSTYSDIGVYDRGLPYYQRHFVAYKGERHVGEASTVYMYDPASPELIRRHVPDVWLIFVLRNPIDRVYSNYWQDIKSGKRLKDFRELLVSHDERIQEMIYVSRYDEHLERYFRSFDARKMIILLYEDMLRDRVGFFCNIFESLRLGAVEASMLELGTVNPSSRPRSAILARFLTHTKLLRTAKAITPKPLLLPFKKVLDSARRANQIEFEYPSMDEECRDRLRDELSDTVYRLSEMLDRDLSFWLEGSDATS